MIQQAEMRSDAAPPIDWAHQVQELIKLLVEAVLMLPDHERRRVLGQSVDILFEALLTLQKVPGIGLIWMALIGSGYPHYARRLSSLDRWCNQETHAVAPGSFDADAKLKETSDVA
jgi:hypothetical protein